MHKVFLGVPSGEDGHVEDGPIEKLDLEGFQSFLGVSGGCTGWVAGCSAALTCSQNPSVLGGS